MASAARLPDQGPSLKQHPQIRLIVLDIDGVVTKGEAQPLDLGLMGSQAELNRSARSRPGSPAFTLCSSRPAPYVELLLQAIDAYSPAIYENGAGLYSPLGYQFTHHPDMRFISDRFQAVRDRLGQELVATGKAYFQPGKVYGLTLFAREPIETQQLRDLATAALGPLSDQVDLVYSTSCLNVLRRGIDRARLWPTSPKPLRFHWKVCSA